MTLPDWKSSDIWGPRICKPCEILDGLVRGKAGWACLFRELGVVLLRPPTNSDGFMILMSCREYIANVSVKPRNSDLLPHQFSAHTTRKFRKTLASPEREFPNFSTSAVQNFETFAKISNRNAKSFRISTVSARHLPVVCLLIGRSRLGQVGSSGVKWGTAHENMMILLRMKELCLKEVSTFRVQELQRLSRLHNSTLSYTSLLPHFHTSTLPYLSYSGLMRTFQKGS